jgi:regulator of protease activity HflC (stomatin/prohibitin superfamily)
MKAIGTLIALVALVAGGYTFAWVTLSYEIGPQEYGVVFSAMPPEIGGGVSNNVLVPGSRDIIWPWEKLYRVNTGEQSIEWGPEAKGDNKAVDDSLYTRALDGNEVALAVTVKYRIKPEKVPHIVQRVGIDNVRPLVKATARADIRTHLNTLKTKGFIDPDLRDRAFLQVTQALNYRLNNEGIEVLLVDYSGHRFERQTPDGLIDATYQEKIDDAQKTLETVNKEPQSRDALVEDKNRLLRDMEGQMKQLIEEAKGYERAAIARGDNYLKKRQYDAERIRDKGLMEIEGIHEKIKALSGTGGKDLLRLEIAKELAKSQPRFVLIQDGSAGNGEIDVQRVDTNELIEQVGLFAVGKEGFKEDGSKAQPETEVEAKESE